MAACVQRQVLSWRRWSDRFRSGFVTSAAREAFLADTMVLAR
jgi:hypothetical protein